MADKFAGYGSYTFFPNRSVPLESGTSGGMKTVNHTKVQALHTDIQTLRHGLPERRVWFAGEHTAPFVALGTVTGAWWSGDGVARRILEGRDGLGRVPARGIGDSVEG